MKVGEAIQRVQILKVYASTGGRCIHCARPLQLGKPDRCDYMVMDFIKNEEICYIFPFCHDCAIDKY
jgi:hypothetical protein